MDEAGTGTDDDDGANSNAKMNRQISAQGARYDTSSFVVITSC